MVYGGADGQAAPPAVTPAQSRRRVAPSPCGRRWRRSVGGGGGSAKPALRRTHSLTHARTRTRTHIASVGRRERRKPSGRTRHYRSRLSRVSPAPCGPRPAAHFHTDCRVLTWMAAGQALQSGSVARYRQFEPTRFESAPPLSRFIMKPFKMLRSQAFEKTSA